MAKETEKRKKVLFVATVDSHIELFHVPYLKMFHDKGWEVHVATDTDKKIPFCDKKICLPIKRSPFKFLSNFKAVRKLKKIAQEEGYNIVHCHTPMGSVVARLACKKARRNGTRVIYTAHGFHFYTGAPMHFWLMFYPVEWYLAKFTDTLITINNEDFERAKAKFGKRCRDIQYVPGVGVDPKKFEKKLSAKEKLKLREELGLSADDKVLIFPAELSKRKNQMWLIKTLEPLFKKDKSYHLLLPGKDSLNGKCQKLAIDLGLEGRVHFLGFRKDIPELLQISDIAVSSSKQEGLPVNLIEAAMLGLPIVATDCRGNRDVCEKTNEQIFINEDVNKLIRALGNTNSAKKNTLHKVASTTSGFSLTVVRQIMKGVYYKPETILIIPSCNDLNRGDQALVLETKNLVEEVYDDDMTYYMMGAGDMKQCKTFGINPFSDILLHPSRKDNKKGNVNYGVILKIRWGIIALHDYIQSKLLLNIVTRSIVKKFLDDNRKKSLQLYGDAKAVFVKGGGFLHDYNGGLIGIYTVYYQLFHIRLALAMGKKIYVMPNSFGPFYSKRTQRMVNSVLDKCSLVTARESISASAKTNGLNRDIEQFPDLAFYMNDKTNRSKKALSILEENGIDVKTDKLIAITARPYRFSKGEDSKSKYRQYKDGLKELIEYLQLEGYKVLMVVHTRAENEHENDEKCIDEVIANLDSRDSIVKIKDDTMDCYDLKELYGYCKFVIGTRFHSVIFSLQQLIPCIAITYGGNKGNGIMHDIELSKYAIKMEEVSGKRLIRVFNDLEKEQIEYKKKVSKYLNNTTSLRRELIDLIGGC